MKLFVGNLSADVSPGLIQSTFEAYGTVSNVSLTKADFTDEFIAQIEMPNATEASNALKNIDGKTIGGKSVVIKNKKELIDRLSDAAKPESSEQVQDKISTIGNLDPAPDIDEYARMTSEDRRDLNSERRKIRSSLFSREKGIVIDRRNIGDRRDSI